MKTLEDYYKTQQISYDQSSLGNTSSSFKTLNKTTEFNHDDYAVKKSWPIKSK